MRVAITGASGLIGGALSAALRERGHEVLPVSRTPPPEGIRWHPHTGFEPPTALSGVDAVVHLAGESIAGRWTDDKKAKIRDSRVEGTKRVITAIAGANPRPKVLVNASAVGLYGGDRGDELLSEDSPAGDDFLAEVTGAWEREARELEELEGPRVRLCLSRFGLVLAREGGALAKMITPFRLGAGGRIGSGEQWMSWIHIDDVVGGLLALLDNEGMRGPYNFVAPNPVRNREFSKALGDALHRPTVIPLPRFAVKAALGEMGETLLLHGQRVEPARLLAAGVEFRFPTIEGALGDLVG